MKKSVILLAILVLFVPYVLATSDLVIQNLKTEVTGGVLRAEIIPSFEIKNIGDKAVNTSLTIQTNVEPKPFSYRIHLQSWSPLMGEIYYDPEIKEGSRSPDIIKAKQIEIKSSEGSRYEYPTESDGKIFNKDKDINDISRPLMITLNPGESYVSKENYGGVYKYSSKVIVTQSGSYNIELKLEDGNSAKIIVPVNVKEYITKDTIDQTHYNPKDLTDIEDKEFFIPMSKRCEEGMYHIVDGLDGKEYKVCIKKTGTFSMTYEVNGKDIYFNLVDMVLDKFWTAPTKNVDIDGINVKITLRDPGMKIRF